MFRIRNKTDAIAWAWLALVLALAVGLGWLAWQAIWWALAIWSLVFPS